MQNISGQNSYQSDNRSAESDDNSYFDKPSSLGFRRVENAPQATSSSSASSRGRTVFQQLALLKRSVNQLLVSQQQHTQKVEQQAREIDVLIRQIEQQARENKVVEKRSATLPTIHISEEIIEKAQAKKNAVSFAIALLTLKSNVQDLYRVSLSGSSARVNKEKKGEYRQKLKLDEALLNSILHCAEVYRPKNFEKAKIRVNLATHLTRLNQLFKDLRDGRRFGSSLIARHKLTKEHLCLKGFNEILINREATFARLDERVERILKGEYQNQLDQPLQEDDPMQRRMRASEIVSDDEEDSSYHFQYNEDMFKDDDGNLLEFDENDSSAQMEEDDNESSFREGGHI